MAANLEIVIKAIDQTGGTLDKVGAKVGGIGSKLGTAVKAGAAAGGVALVGLGAAAVTSAVKFENAFAEVATLLPELDEKGIGKLKSSVIDFSNEMGIATGDAIPALYQAISAGVPADNVMSFMETAAKASIGGVTDLETAVDGITTVVNTYGEEVISAQEASDLMFTTVKLGKTDFSQLSSALFQVLPTAKSLGVGMDEVSAALATLTAQGVPTSVATTQLRAAFVEASKGGTKLDAAIKELHGGQGLGALIEQGSTSVEVFEAVRNSMPEQEFKDLFGSVEASQAVLSITGDQFETMTSNMDAMASATGATDAAFGVMSETAQFKLNQAITMLKNLLLQVGLEILPVLADALAEIVPWLQENLPKAIEAGREAFEAIRPFIESFIEGLEILFPIWLAGWKWVLDNKPVLIAALTAIGVAVVLAFGPVGIATVAIIGLIALLPQLGAIWEEVKGAVVGAVDAIKTTITDAFNEVLGFLTGNWTEILSIALLFFTGPAGLIFLFVSNSFGIRDKVFEIFGEIKAFFLAIPGELLAAIGDVLGTLWQKGRDLLQGLINGYLSLWQTALNFYISLPGKLFTALGSALTALWSKGRDLLQGLLNGIYSIEMTVLRFFTNLPGRIWSAMGNLGSLLWGKGRDLIQGLVSGIFSVSIPNPLDLIPGVGGAIGAIGSLSPFHEGGFVPAGVNIPAMLHGPEFVIPAAQMPAIASAAAGGGGATFLVNFNGPILGDRIEADLMAERLVDRVNRASIFRR